MTGRISIDRWRLYVITDAQLSRGRSHLEVMEAAILGGADVIQLRDKTASGGDGCGSPPGGKGRGGLSRGGPGVRGPGDQVGCRRAPGPGTDRAYPGGFPASHRCDRGDQGGKCPAGPGSGSNGRGGDLRDRRGGRYRTGGKAFEIRAGRRMRRPPPRSEERVGETGEFTLIDRIKKIL